MSHDLDQEGLKTFFVYNPAGGVRIRYQYHRLPRCVVCGIALTDLDFERSGRALVAPCCKDHIDDCGGELLKNLSMWPDDWSGHWAKESSSDTWEQI